MNPESRIANQADSPEAGALDEKIHETVATLSRLDLFEPPVIGADAETAEPMEQGALDAIRKQARDLSTDDLQSEIQHLAPSVIKHRTSGECMNEDEVRLAVLAQESSFREKLESAAEKQLEVQEIAPGVFWMADYRFNVPASYALVMRDNIAVIDPGIALTMQVAEPLHDARQDFLRSIEERYGRRSNVVMLTHADLDHLMAIPEMAGENAMVYARPENFEDLADPEGAFVRKEKTLKKLTGKGFNADEIQRIPGYAVLSANTFGPKSNYPKPLGVPGGGIRYADFPSRTIELDEGEMEVVPLPGHAAGEAGFWFPETRTLVTGDLIPNDHPERAEYPDFFLPPVNIYEARESLKKILEMEPDRISPAHGPMIEGHEAVQKRVSAMTKNVDDIIYRTQVEHRVHPEWSVAQLAKEVYGAAHIPKSRFFGPREQQTTVVSVLHDAPKEGV